MAELEEGKVKALLAKGKYREAEQVLNNFVFKEKNNDTAWYLLGILALKLKNYDHAHEYFERALALNKKPEYLMFDGLAYLENLDIEEAEGRFAEYLAIRPEDASVNFYLALCYLLLGDPRSRDAFRKAYSIDKERTRRMLRDFFVELIEKNPAYSEAVKEELKKKIG
ncbi:MAG: tetratricopeptide repeat protein [Candidatus Bilamarchaeaceae archaeon]